MTNCPHCNAPLKPAARFCLACDRPLDDTSRLSVGDPVVVEKGRPVVAVLGVAGAVVALAAAAYGGLAFIHHQHDHSRQLVVSDVRKGTSLIVSAEAGHAAACQRAARMMAGPAKDVERECAALVDDDPGAKISGVTVDRLNLQGLKGTAHLHATVHDATGTHTIDRTVDLVRAHKVWRLAWDGQREV